LVAIYPAIKVRSIQTNEWSVMQANTVSNFDTLPATGYMRQPQVLEVVPFSAATMWRKAKQGTFPKPVKLSERVTAWRVGDVRQFLASQAGTEVA
jgi:predicted DNA-binding transcriptional regulator AlpA